MPSAREQWLGSGVIVAAFAIGGTAAGRTPPPDYGYQWATITHPGNRHVNADEGPNFHPPYSGPNLRIGRVDYIYRIATAEVTTGQYLEFVNAYAPYHTGFAEDINFTGRFIRATSLGSVPTYGVDPQYENVAADMSWYFAARYVNWLSSGKATHRDAFEQGVYDASTFTQLPDGTWPVPASRSPNAAVWIPTRDEWIKAAHYDPHRYGPGQEGYWKRPTGQDAALISGYPEDGGQTSAGIPLPSDGSLPRPVPVGAYPLVQSPWGLLDVSGGVTEWAGDGPDILNIRFAHGSFAFGPNDPELTDLIDGGGAGRANFGGAGLRLAALVPGPGGSMILSVCVFIISRRRRKRSWSGSR